MSTVYEIEELENGRIIFLAMYKKNNHARLTSEKNINSAVCKTMPKNNPPHAI